MLLCDVDSGECIKTFNGHNRCINSVAFSLDNRLIVSGSDDHSIKLWNVDTCECIKIFLGHNKCVNSVAFSF